jgi:fructose-specific component phosphotransferase system IIB-like protein
MNTRTIGHGAARLATWMLGIATLLILTAPRSAAASVESGLRIAEAVRTEHAITSQLLGMRVFVDVLRVAAPHDAARTRADTEVVFIADSDNLCLTLAEQIRAGATHAGGSVLIVGIRAADAFIDAPNAFAAFIEDELKPYIASRYDVNMRHTALLGSEITGTLVLHVMFNKPGALGRYVVVSPNLAVDSERIFREEVSFGNEAVRLYVVGGESDATDANSNLLDALDARLYTRSRPLLDYRFHILPDATSRATVIRGFVHGLNFRRE